MRSCRREQAAAPDRRRPGTSTNASPPRRRGLRRRAGAASPSRSGPARGPAPSSARRAPAATDRSTTPTRPTRVCAARPTACRSGSSACGVNSSSSSTCAITCCRSSLVVSGGIRSSAAKPRAWLTVSLPCTTSSCGTMPIRLRNDAYSAWTSCPSNDTAPLVGRAARRSPSTSVDLPEPDGPITAVSVPGRAVNEIRSSSVTVHRSIVKLDVAYLETTGRRTGRESSTAGADRHRSRVQAWRQRGRCGNGHCDRLS